MVSSFPLKKNTATRIVFPILDADGDPVGGAANLDSEYSIDGGVFTNCTNEATDITSDAANTGIYYLDLVQAETNGDVICIQVKTSTAGAKTTVLVFYTAAQTLDETDVICDGIKAKTDLIGASVALEAVGNIASILADTNELQTDWVNGGRLDLLLDSAISKIDAVDDYVDTEVAAILAAVVTEVADIKAITDTLTLAAIADAIHDEATEGAITLRKAVNIMLAALAGKSSGGGTNNIKFRDQADSKNRIDATVDADGNRTAITNDGA